MRDTEPDTDSQTDDSENAEETDVTHRLIADISRRFRRTFRVYKPPES
jgi:hypothetical protein